MKKSKEKKVEKRKQWTMNEKIKTKQNKDRW